MHIKVNISILIIWVLWTTRKRNGLRSWSEFYRDGVNFKSRSTEVNLEFCSDVGRGMDEINRGNNANVLNMQLLLSWYCRAPDTMRHDISSNLDTPLCIHGYQLQWLNVDPGKKKLSHPAIVLLSSERDHKVLSIIIRTKWASHTNRKDCVRQRLIC